MGNHPKEVDAPTAPMGELPEKNMNPTINRAEVTKRLLDGDSHQVYMQTELDVHNLKPDFHYNERSDVDQFLFLPLLDDMVEACQRV